MTAAIVTPVTETVVTADEQPNRVKEHYNTLLGARDRECDTPNEQCEGVCDFLMIECLVDAADAKAAALWLPSVDEAKAYAFWAGEIRRLNPREGGTKAGLLASLLGKKKPIPPEYRTAYQQQQKEARKAAKAAEEARKAANTQQAEADAHKIRLFNLELFLQELPADERARFDASALKRLRQTNRVASDALVKNAQDARYTSLLQAAQLAEWEAWPSASEAGT